MKKGVFIKIYRVSHNHGLVTFGSQLAVEAQIKTEDRDVFKAKFDKNDLEESGPHNFRSPSKIWLVLHMGLLALCGSLGSSIISPGSQEIAKYTGVSLGATSLTVALFILGWFEPLDCFPP